MANELENLSLEEILQSGNLVALYLRGNQVGNYVLNSDEVNALLGNASFVGNVIAINTRSVIDEVDLNTLVIGSGNHELFLNGGNPGTETFTTNDGKTVTVRNGMITDIT